MTRCDGSSLQVMMTIQMCQSVCLPNDSLETNSVKNMHNNGWRVTKH